MRRRADPSALEARDAASVNADVFAFLALQAIAVVSAVALVATILLLAAPGPEVDESPRPQ
jgi:hypothetical protein